MKRLNKNVSYDVAVALRDRGFDEETYWYYHEEVIEDGMRFYGEDSLEMVGNEAYPVRNSTISERIAAPTVAEAMDWLMDGGIVVCVISYSDDCWNYVIYKDNHIHSIGHGRGASWDVAVNDGIIKALELL